MEKVISSLSTTQTCLTSRQEAVLRAYVDALLPSLVPPPLRAPDSSLILAENDALNSATKSDIDSSILRYWKYRLSSDPLYMNALSETILHKMSSFDTFSILMLLNVLDTTIGTCLLFNVYRHPRRFVDFTLLDRSQILLPSLQNSKDVMRRKIFQSLKNLLSGLAFTYHCQSMEYLNPFWKAVGYPGSPVSWLSPEIDEALIKKTMDEQMPIIEELKRSKQQVLQCTLPLLELDCDVVIVGSGSGGSVAAQVLSSAGYDVIVLEKGAYQSPSAISLHEIHALEHQYEQSGLLQNTAGTIMILAGSTLGGGPAVNWACCLPLPQHVRDEWIHEHKLHDSLGPEYDASLRFILETLDVREKDASKASLTHNAMNRKLQEGCNSLGYEWKETGQSLRDVEHDAAGHIGMGDRYGNKNGAIQNFLVDAVRCGARIFDSCQVEKIVMTPTSTGRRATGVECRVTYDSLKSRPVLINARKSVVVSAGALHTPCILRKSGLRNTHIGKHLRLHPVTGVMGFYPSDDRIDSIRGAPMTTVCNEFEKGPLENGYGAKIECPCTYPGLIAAASPWISAQLFKERMLKYSHCVPLIALQRDSGDGGTVKQSLDGKSLVIDYKVNRNDAQSLVATMQGATDILVASGAEEVATGHIRDVGFKVQGNLKTGNSDDLSLEMYKSSIANRGIPDNEMGLFSAHQMGTCRMSASSEQGPVDVNGETWECDDLYVMDASVFPTASGSNPMVTVLTLSHVLSTRLSHWLKVRDHLDESKATTLSTTTLSEKEQLLAVDMLKRRTLIRSQKVRRMHELTSFRCLAVVPVLLVVVYWMW